MSGSVKSIREDGSKPLLVSSSASPLVMRMSCSMVIGVARIGRIAPGGDRRRHRQREPALPHQDADERVGDRLGHRPAEHGRVDPVAGRVALGHDAAVVQHDHRLRAATRPGLRLGERAIEGGAQLRVGRLDHRRARDVGRASGRAPAGDAAAMATLGTEA